MHPLDGARAKTGRARKHLDALGDELDAWLNQPANRTIIKDDGDWKVAAFHTAPPTLAPGVVVGDLIHNLSSALDHVAFEIVPIAGGKRGRHTYFPLYADEDDFRRDVSHRDPGRSGRSPLHQVSVSHPVFALIERYQPYNCLDAKDDPGHRPEWDKLAQIGTLSRIDKHRTLVTQFVFVPSDQQPLDVIKWNPAARLIEQRDTWSHAWPLEDGTELARWRFDPTGPDPEMHVEGKYAIDPAFGYEDDRGGGMAVTVKGLRELIERVEEVVAAFDQFFT